MFNAGVVTAFLGFLAMACAHIVPFMLLSVGMALALIVAGYVLGGAMSGLAIGFMIASPRYPDDFGAVLRSGPVFLYFISILTSVLCYLNYRGFP